MQCSGYECGRSAAIKCATCASEPLCFKHISLGCKTCHGKGAKVVPLETAGGASAPLLCKTHFSLGCKTCHGRGVKPTPVQTGDLHVSSLGVFYNPEEREELSGLWIEAEVQEDNWVSAIAEDRKFGPWLQFCECKRPPRGKGEHTKTHDNVDWMCEIVTKGKLVVIQTDNENIYDTFGNRLNAATLKENEDNTMRRVRLLLRPPIPYLSKGILMEAFGKLGTSRYIGRMVHAKKFQDCSWFAYTGLFIPTDDNDWDASLWLALLLIGFVYATTLYDRKTGLWTPEWGAMKSLAVYNETTKRVTPLIMVFGAQSDKGANMLAAFSAIFVQDITKIQKNRAHTNVDKMIVEHITAAILPRCGKVENDITSAFRCKANIRVANPTAKSLAEPTSGVVASVIIKRIRAQPWLLAEVAKRETAEDLLSLRNPVNKLFPSRKVNP